METATWPTPWTIALRSAAVAEPIIERPLITAEPAEQVIALKERLPKPPEPVQSSSPSPEEDA